MGGVIGQIPEFTTDESVEKGIEEVKQPTTDEVVEETETPTELPAEPTEEVEEQPTLKSEDTEQPEIPSEALNKALSKKALSKATEGLRNEIVELKRELAAARGNDRKLIQQEIIQTQQKLDDISDVDPKDVSLIEKVLKTKGYVTKEEANRMAAENIQKQILNDFLEKYPEYKPENDPNDINWKALQKELSLYRSQEDPSKIREILERAHRTIKPSVVSDLNIPAKKRAAQVASAGAGGVQRSSSGKTLSPEMRRYYEDGGWSEEDIKAIEKSLE